MSIANAVNVPVKNAMSSPVSFISGADSSIRRRLFLSRVFSGLCRFVTYAALAVLVVLLTAIIWSSLGRLAPDFR